MACLYFRIFTKYELELNQAEVYTNHRLEKSFTHKSKVSRRGLGIFSLTTDKKAPSFRFYLRPWKVETAIQTNEPCKVKQGRLLRILFLNAIFECFICTIQLMLGNST